MFTQTSPVQHNQTIESLKPPQAIQNTVQDKIQTITERFSAIYPETPFKVVVAGSVACGHYDGPKPTCHSLNAHCPKDFTHVIETDLRIIVPPEFDVLDPTNVRNIEWICDAIPEDTTFHTGFLRFYESIDMAMVYSYQPLADGIAYEFEVCVNNAPYYEIASVWNKVFTPEEIEHQKLLRNLGRDVITLDYETDYLDMKKCQVQECRYRIFANFWLQHTYGQDATEIATFKPLPNHTPEFLTKLSKAWGTTFTGEGYESPSIVPPKVAKIFTDHGYGELLQPVTRPIWIQVAEALRAKQTH